MRLLWLAEVLRAAGLTVHEVSGWRTRGSASWGPIRGITCHETRGSRTSTDAGEIRVLIEGSTTAPPPIAQLYLSRTGAWHVVASGKCHHNKVGRAGPNEGYGNSQLLGIEAQHAAGEPWTDVQYESYVRGVAALVRTLSIPVSRVAGHKEHQPGEKTDPAFDMIKFRRDVAAAMEGDMPLTSDDLSKIRSQVALGLYDALWIAANGTDYRDLKYSGPGAIGVAVRANLGALATAPVRDDIAAVRAGQEAILAALRGADTAAILARIDEVAAEERAHRDELAAAEAARDAELAELVRQAQAGELDYEQLVAALLRHAARQG